MKHRRFVAGEMLFRLGDPPASAFVILQGEVEVARGGDPGPHEKLGPGQVVGEVALMVNRAQTTAAKAVTDTTVAIITREAFLTALESQRSVVNPFLKRLFETLHDVPSLVSKGAPPLAAMTGSTTNGTSGAIRASTSTTVQTTAGECSMPVLTASAPMSASTTSICCATNSGGTS